MDNIKKPDLKHEEVDFFLCYNCGIEIIDKTQIYCPNCNVILNPNNYISWERSWWGFVSLICLIPVLIALSVVFL